MNRPAGAPSSSIVRYWSAALPLMLVLLQIPTSATAGDGSIDPANGSMEFEVNFRYPPTTQQIEESKLALTQMSQMICDATDGQVQVTDIRLTGGQVEEDAAAFWYHASAFRSGGFINNDGSSLSTLGDHLDIAGGAQFRGDILAHEMGHHAFGLGEQYEEQRRWSGCGIGQGFEYDAIDEQRHSLMQQSGAAQCVGGVPAGGLLGDGERCRWDAECASNSCQPWLMSEFSVATNHDLVAGDTDFPTPTASTTIEFFGVLTEEDGIDVFDPTDWGTAQASSSEQFDVEVLDDTGAVPGVEVNFFATRTAANQWMISAAIDDGLVGGTDGDLNLLEQWNIDFSADSSLNTVSEMPATLSIAGLTSGAADIDLTLEFGTPGGTDYQQDIVNWAGIVGGLSSILWGTANGAPFCDMDYVKGGWLAATSRWETSEQSHRHNGLSDWETLVQNYPFLVAPAGLPVEASPAVCLAAPNYVEDVTGSDQVLLIVDRSGSMDRSSHSSIDEVCDNGADDDGDGTTDESQCAESRLKYVQSAARAFVDLQVDSGIDLGILEFNENNNPVRPIAALNSANAEDVKLDINGLLAGGWTAIGDALEASKAEFAAAATAGRSQTAFLLTDGYNNRGADPETKVQDLKDANIRVFTIPAGSAADVAGLSEIAANTGGYMVAANPIDELPAVYAELAGQYMGAGLVLQRTPFLLSRKDDGSQPDRLPERVFILPVEKGADALVAFISGRNGQMDTWRLGVQLYGPDGSYYDMSSPEITVDPYYVFFRIPNPAAGEWKLRAMPGNSLPQNSIALAFVENAEPRLLADVRPRAVSASKPVRISAAPIYVVELETGVEISGTVKRPDGSQVPISLVRGPGNQSFATEFSDYVGRGYYEITLALNTSGEALPFRGESIFEGPERYPIDVVPFERQKTLGFLVRDGAFPECRGDDCDGDGIPNDEECGRDTDKDGVPNIWDTDSDNDEIPDSIEGLLDRNKNGIPDSCDPETSPLPGSVPPNLELAIDDERAVLALVCAGRFEKAKQSLVTSIKRIERLRRQLDEPGLRPDSRRARRDIQRIIDRILELKRELYSRLKEKESACKLSKEILSEAEELEMELIYILGGDRSPRKQRR